MLWRMYNDTMFEAHTHTCSGKCRAGTDRANFKKCNTDSQNNVYVHTYFEETEWLKKWNQHRDSQREKYSNTST